MDHIVLAAWHAGKAPLTPVSKHRFRLIACGERAAIEQSETEKCYAFSSSTQCRGSTDR
jgi:hypothetical protein